ncbi:MAG TPA: hypothetical protein VGS80_04655, partial [Ktedonobacterales bacterium]|nr:hypothetical protein [Ktedonobacterales bacterium]
MGIDAGIGMNDDADPHVEEAGECGHGVIQEVAGVPDRRDQEERYRGIQIALALQRRHVEEGHCQDTCAEEEMFRRGVAPDARGDEQCDAHAQRQPHYVRRERTNP